MSERKLNHKQAVAKKSKSGKIDFDSLMNVITVLMTRNYVGADRATKNLGFRKNMASLNSHPENHLTYALKSISDMAAENKSPSFEHGMMVGVSIALCSRAPETRVLLNKIHAEILSQQAQVVDIKKGAIAEPEK